MSTPEVCSLSARALGQCAMDNLSVLICKMGMVPASLCFVSNRPKYGGGIGSI